MKTEIKVTLRPFALPGEVEAEGPCYANLSLESPLGGAKPIVLHIEQLTPEQLEELAEDFTQRLFKKANKQRPPQPAIAVDPSADFAAELRFEGAVALVREYNKLVGSGAGVLDPENAEGLADLAQTVALQVTSPANVAHKISKLMPPGMTRANRELCAALREFEGDWPRLANLLTDFIDSRSEGYE